MEYARKLTIRAWNSPTLTTWLSFFTTTLRAAVVLPLVVSLLDPQRIALYYLMSSIIGLCAIAGNAFNRTYIRCFSYVSKGATQLKDFHLKKSESEQPNYHYLNGLHAGIKHIHLRVSLLTLLVGTIIGLLFLGKQTSSLPSASIEIWLTFSLFLLTLLIGTWTLLHRSYLDGTGKIALANKLSVIGGIIAMFLTALFLQFGWNLYAFGIANLTGAAIGFLFIKGQATKERKTLLSYTPTEIHAETKEAILPPSIKQSLLALSSNGVNRGAGLIAAFFLTGEALASYLQAISLIFMITGFSQAPFYSQIPRFSALRSSGEIHALAQSSGRAMRKSFLAYGIAAVAVTYFVPLMFHLVDSNISFLDHRLWLALCCIWLFERHTAMCAQLYTTQNKVPLFKIGILTGLIKLSMMYFLASSHGVAGLLFAHALSNALIMLWFMPITGLRTLGTHWRTNVNLHAPALLLTLFLMAGLIWYSPLLTQASISLITP